MSVFLLFILKKEIINIVMKTNISGNFQEPVKILEKCL